MAIAGLVLALVAGVAMLVFGIQIVVRAFKTSVGWGLASLFIPLAVLVFVFKHWAQTKRPFLGGLACVPVYALASLLMALGGGMTMTVTPRGASTIETEAADDPGPISGPVVETTTLVLKTVTAREAEEVADPNGLQACGEAYFGRMAIAPQEVRICSRYTDFFGETKVGWQPVAKDKTYSGDPLAGQWMSWLHVARKGTGEQVAFVVFQVAASQDGRVQLQCDAGGTNRTQINGTPPSDRDFRAECETVAEKLALGQILFNWNPKRPAVRFRSQEGPAIDLNLIKVG